KRRPGLRGVGRGVRDLRRCATPVSPGAPGETGVARRHATDGSTELPKSHSMTCVDYLIVGSGLTGAVIARTLADAGREVLVGGRRAHQGGNVHDHDHASGIRIHTYGPHYFRTSSERVWEFATRFAPFYKYEAALLSDVDGVLEQWPIAGSYINKH